MTTKTGRLKRAEATTSELKPGGVLTVNRASGEIGVHHDTLYTWIAAGKLVYVEFGGVFFIPVAEINRLRAERLRKQQLREVTRLKKELEKPTF